MPRGTSPGALSLLRRCLASHRLENGLFGGTVSSETNYHCAPPPANLFLETQTLVIPAVHRFGSAKLQQM